MTDKFRIESVRIEGFKGFTKEQEIPLQSNNTFVFGNNGFGKSSILEAIAWCLFGESRKSETELRNSDYYDGDCKVELKLARNGEERRVVRKMTRASAEAPAEVVLENGERRGLNATFPDRKRLGGPGTDVLFATQGIAGRSVSDITNFKDVISAHLGLDRIESIRKELATQAGNFEKDFADSEKKWTKYEEEIDVEIQTTSDNLNAMEKILAASSSSLPTKLDTDRAIVDLYSEIAADPSDKQEFLNASRLRRLGRLNELLKNIQLDKETIRSKIVREQTNLSMLVTIKQSYETAILTKSSLGNDIEKVGKQKIERFGNLTSEALDERVSVLLDQRTNLERDFLDKKKELETKAAQLSSSAEAIQSELSVLSSLMSKRNEIEKELSKSKETRKTILGQFSEESLKDRETDLEGIIKRKNLLQTLVIRADEYCGLHGYNECPVCNTEKDMSEHLERQTSSLPRELDQVAKELKNVKSQLEALASNSGVQTDFELGLRDLEAKLGENPSQRATKFEESIRSQKVTIERANQTLLDLEKERRDQIQALDQEIQLLNEQRGQIYPLEMIESNCRGSLHSILGEISQLEEQARASQRFELIPGKMLESLVRSVGLVTKQISLLQDQETNAASAIRNYEARVKQLTLESQYHQLKDHRLSLIDYKSNDEWKEVEVKFGDYRSFLDELSVINLALIRVYENEMRARIERINERIGPVYKLLTQQRSYPFAEIRLENDEKSGLEVRLWVGTAIGDSWRRPEEVLNEQARNAVRLLPYFVFSELGMLQHDFDFLLIDDPSQSFDSSHLDALMKLLESISTEVQIIVATHEKARFENSAGKLPRTSVIEVLDFDPSRGPKLVYNGSR